MAAHGETHTRNRVRTAAGLRLVDGESLPLAPRERDLTSLVQAGYGQQAQADPGLLEIVDLEWRLAEVAEYAGWFAARHVGSSKDATAFAGLLDELPRGPWRPAG